MRFRSTPFAFWRTWAAWPSGFIESTSHSSTPSGTGVARRSSRIAVPASSSPWITPITSTRRPPGVPNRSATIGRPSTDRPSPTTAASGRAGRAHPGSAIVVVVVVVVVDVVVLVVLVVLVSRGRLVIVVATGVDGAVAATGRIACCAIGCIVSPVGCAGGQGARQGDQPARPPRCLLGVASRRYGAIAWARRSARSMYSSVDMCVDSITTGHARPASSASRHRSAHTHH